VKTIDTAAILAFGRVRTMFTYGVHQSSWRIEQPSIALCLPYRGKLRGLHVTFKGSVIAMSSIGLVEVSFRQTPEISSLFSDEVFSDKVS